MTHWYRGRCFGQDNIFWLREHICFWVVHKHFFFYSNWCAVNFSLIYFHSGVAWWWLWYKSLNMYWFIVNKRKFIPVNNSHVSWVKNNYLGCILNIRMGCHTQSFGEEWSPQPQCCENLKSCMYYAIYLSIVCVGVKRISGVEEHVKYINSYHTVNYKTPLRKNHIFIEFIYW